MSSQNLVGDQGKERLQVEARRVGSEGRSSKLVALFFAVKTATPVAAW
jgi:hypothetical protein